MAQFNSKNKASRTARRWFTDIDINMKIHPDSGDVSDHNIILEELSSYDLIEERTLSFSIVLTETAEEGDIMFVTMDDGSK